MQNGQILTVTKNKALPALLGLLFVFFCVETVSAKPPKARTPTSYKELIREALAAKKSGDLQTVLKRLIAAHKLKPSPTLLNNIGKTHQDLGNFKEAYDSYALVVNDANASSELRSINAARLVSVNRYLNKAWLRLAHEGEGKMVYLNGQRAFVDETINAYGCPSERCSVLVYGGQDATGTIRSVQAKMGRITTLPKELFTASKSDAYLAFKELSRPVQSVEINGVVFRDLDWANFALTLDSEEHKITVVYQDGARVHGVLNAEPDETYSMAKVVTAWAKAKKKRAPNEITTATLGKRDAGQGLKSRSVYPWITAGAGLVTLGIGGYLYWDASAARQDLNALIGESETGPITRIDQPSFFSERDKIESNSTLGSWLMVAGGAVTLSGVIWLFLDRSRHGTSSVDVSPKETTRNFDLRLVGTTLVMGVRY